MLGDSDFMALGFRAQGALQLSSFFGGCGYGTHYRVRFYPPFGVY